MPSWNPPSSSSASYRRREARTAPPLPSGFTNIRDLVDERIPVGRPVSVIGVVKDYRRPVSTKGSSWKCTLTIYDQSTQDGNDGIVLNIFREKEEMPPVAGGDVVVVHLAKTQRYGSEQTSLISNWGTDIHIYERAKIPRPPRSAFLALKEPSRKLKQELKQNVHEYVSWMYDEIDKDNLPDETQLEARSAQSLNVRDKFSLLKDVRDGKFCDAIVQIVKEPYDLGDKITIWVSDYTENPSFYNMTWDGADSLLERDGDPYGYTTGKFSANGNPGSKWTGPFGKKSLQVTCWEPHANVVRNDLKLGDWVRLRNVQIRYGRNSANIEGFVRQDRDFPDKVNVALLDVHDPESADPRLKEAIRRKKGYEKEKKGQLKDIKSEVSGMNTGMKRKAEEVEEVVMKTNSKERRRQRRAGLEKKAKEEEPDVNDLVKCENHDQKISPFPSLLEPAYFPNSDTDKTPLPFTNVKWRINARVVDFHPSRLVDFAVSRRTTEFDLLSDASVSDSDSAASDDGTLDHFAGQRIWEWRFALKLEDAAAPQPSKSKKDGTVDRPASVWVVVDNLEGQLLTGLDATDLRAEPKTLDALREQMFKLWGDLEERKAAVEERRKKKEAAAKRDRRPGDRPPLESSDEEGDVDPTQQREPGLSQASNKPFTCCVKQYGVEVKAADPAEADAGNGKKWQRTFALFGTKICA
ncbi:Telomere-binding alpha subunit central domain-containing protein [Pleurostoma richardsiae]|uniref:Protection of telomeres protein 1 n=1 Tax=Pleurostoma richardsiae TaxID=41990 RepID=A0AA38VEJ0_9PEZI|nr:Telomere-binding alpha subunit central domain-containing protein [Pleurostoma richardsiae]